MTLFQEVKKASVSETIVQQVKDLILRGQLEAGDKLPSERELSEQLRVGRSSVREATSALLALGVIEIRSGEGVFVREDFPRSTLECVEWSSLLLNQHSDDLPEARICIEVPIARLAASRATPDERQHLRELVDQMAQATHLERFVDLDIGFHLALAEASRNVVLRDIVVGIQQLMQSSMLEVLQSERLRTLSNEQHRQLCDTLDRRSADDAEKVIRNHLQKDIDFFRKARG